MTLKNNLVYKKEILLLRNAFRYLQKLLKKLIFPRKIS